MMRFGAAFQRVMIRVFIGMDIPFSLSILPFMGMEFHRWHALAAPGLETLDRMDGVWWIVDIDSMSTALVVFTFGHVLLK